MTEVFDGKGKTTDHRIAVIRGDSIFGDSGSSLIFKIRGNKIYGGRSGTTLVAEIAGDDVFDGRGKSTDHRIAQIKGNNIFDGGNITSESRIAVMKNNDVYDSRGINKIIQFGGRFSDVHVIAMLLLLGAL